MNRRIWFVVAILATTLALLLLAANSFFFFRDNFATHFAVKAVTAEALRAGELPLWNEHVGGGQPLAGNPNTLTFYPDTLLYAFLPTLTAFNLHFLLHLVGSAGAMFLLLRELAVSKDAAWLTAAAYAFSGVVVTSTAFYNLVTATVLIPLAAAGLLRVMRTNAWSDAYLLGVVCGLMALAGEPVVVLGSSVMLLVLLGAERTAWRDTASKLVASAVIAFAVGSPQLVAYSDIAAEVERGIHRYSAATVLAASLPPWRLLEVIAGPIYGSLLDLTETGFAHNAPQTKWPPLFGSVAIGVPLIAASGVTLERRAARFRWIAAGALLLALGAYNPVVRAIVEEFVSLRVVRYPEKFMLHFNVAAFALIGCWLGDGERGGKRAVILAGMATSLLVALTVWLGWSAPVSMTFVRALAASVLGFSLVLLLLLRARVVLVGSLLLLTLFLWHVRQLPLDAAAPYFGTSEGAQQFSRARIWRPADAPPDAISAQQVYRARAASADPTFGAAFDVRYVLDRSPEGMYSYLSRIVSERAAAAPATLRERYASLLGARAIVERSEGGRIRVTRVTSLPHVHAPRNSFRAGTIRDAVTRLEAPDFEPFDEVVVPAATEISGSAVVRNVAQRRGETTFEVQATGNAPVMINETWFRAWQVTIDGKAAATFPANLDRLGVIVPPGTHTVRATFGRKRTLLAIAIATSMLLLIGAIAIAGGRVARSLRQPDTAIRQ